MLRKLFYVVALAVALVTPTIAHADSLAIPGGGGKGGIAGQSPSNLNQWGGGAQGLLGNGTVASYGYPFNSLKSPSTMAATDGSGTGPIFGTTGDANYLGSGDSSCGTAARCVSFNNPHSNLTAGMGIHIEKIGLTITTCSGCTNGVVKGWTGTITSVQSSTLITISAAPTVTAATNNLAWFAGTEKSAAFQTCFGGTSCTVPTGFYYQSASAVGTANNLSVQCASGAVIMFAEPNTGSLSLWDMHGVNQLSVRGCKFWSDNNREINNSSTAPGYDTVNNEFDYFIRLGWSNLQQNNIEIGYNEFHAIWSQAMVEADGPTSNIPSMQNFFVHDNDFEDCGLYGFVSTGASHEIVAYNRAYNCRLGDEAYASAGQSLRYNWYVGNISVQTTLSGWESMNGGQAGAQTITPDNFAFNGRTTAADGTTTNGFSNITSATAAFVESDVGRSITGTNIPASTTIIAVSRDGKLAMLSANATATGSSIAFTLGNYDFSTDYVTNNIVIGPGRLQTGFTCPGLAAHFINNTLGTNSFGTATSNCSS